MNRTLSQLLEMDIDEALTVVKEQMDNAYPNKQDYMRINRNTMRTTGHGEAQVDYYLREDVYRARVAEYERLANVHELLLKIKEGNGE